MTYTITIEGTKYMMGTRIPVQKIMDMWNKNLPEVSKEQVMKYIRSEGYIVNESLIEKVIKENSTF